jgi:DNA-binding NarL/FixJ family response regulator
MGVDPVGKETRPDLAILVIEPRDLVRHGVRLTMERAGSERVAHVARAARGLDLAARLQPDMAILSATPPDMSAAEATRRILAVAPDCQILVLGGAEDDEIVLDALVEGAVGHLPTLSTPEQLVQRVSLARSGGVPLSRGIAGRLRERLRAARANEPARRTLDLGRLSAREVDVLRLLPTGMDNAEIARALSISTTTVRKHVSSILEKLDLDNRVQAAVRAVRAGLEAPLSPSG